MRLQFLGATGTVTGSKYLLEHGGRKLLVDCGLFQGLKQLRLRNWDTLPIAPADIDAVVLTHAHLDHSGYIPRLVKLGFRGRIHCSAATADLCELLLPDSGRLQEEDASYANRHGFSRHHPALPLYTEDEARRALEHLKPCAIGRPFEPIGGMRVTLRPAGHLLGACSAFIESAGRSVLFSGDLGRRDDLLTKPPAAPPAADYVVIESTYGDRIHPKEDPLTELAHAVNRTAARGGIVLIPAFAVGRAQALLHCIKTLKTEHRIPDLPVYLNSPMAADATELAPATHGRTAARP